MNVPTSCSIETGYHLVQMGGNIQELQQHLPLAVLKLSLGILYGRLLELQQYLLLAVLKLNAASLARPVSPRCNSTYRLRY